MKVRTETEKLPTNYKITDVIPYGYLLDPEDPQNLLIDEEVSIYVRFIFDEYLRGAKIADITKRLSNIGAPSPVRQKQKQGCTYLEGRQADYWIDGHINRILKHEIYIGSLPYIRRLRTHLDLELNERDVSVYPEKAIPLSSGRVNNHHLAYITQEQYLQIQNRLTAEGSTYNRHVINRYDKPIFAGRIFCGTCNRPMRFLRAKKDGVYTYDYYCCSSKFHRVKDSCPQTRYKVDWIKEECWKQLLAEHQATSAIADKMAHFLTDETYQAYDQVLVEAIAKIVDKLQEQDDSISQEDSITQELSFDQESSVIQEDTTTFSNENKDSSGESLSLEEKLKKLMEKRADLRNAYAVNNLWVSLYADMPEDPIIDYDFIRKYITRITVFTDRHIELQLRWMQYKEKIFLYLDPQNAVDFVAGLQIDEM